MNSNRILIVEDDFAIRSLLSTLLARERIAFETAADGDEGLRLLGNGTWSLLLLDLMLPRRSGFEILDWIGEQPQERRPTVVVMTAYSEELFKRRVDPSLVTAVLRKPFDLRELMNTVHSIGRRPTPDAADRHFEFSAVAGSDGGNGNGSSRHES
jgi:DNA-binding response OmpR family regulator